MGLFDKIKKLFRKNKLPMLPEKTSNWNCYKIPGTDKEIGIFNEQMMEQYINEQNKLVNMYIAEVIEYNSDSTINVDSAHYICFELQKELAERVLSGGNAKKEFFNSLAQKYNARHKQNSNQDRFYFGSIEENVVDRDVITYEEKNKNSEINRYFENYVNNEIAKKNIKQKFANTREEFKERIDARQEVERLNKEKAKYDEVRRNRIRNSFLNPRKTRENKIDYNNLDGVDLSQENMGDILKIRNLKKIGKDNNGIYLYTAFLSKSKEIENYEDFDNKDSIPVCFGLYTKIENIIENGNKAEIESVLRFLSDNQKYKDKEKLNFIGQLNKVTQRQANGEITSIIEEADSNAVSPAIKHSVKQLKDDYSNKHGINR